MVLVVLYSTTWRRWDDVVESQCDLIQKLAGDQDVILGIHYWSEMIHTFHINSYGKAPAEPPEQLRRWPYKHTVTEQERPFIERIARNIRVRHAWGLAYIIESTRRALENAEALWRERYGTEMPEDQPILRMRPDTIITDVDSFPTFPKGDDFYLSNWDRGNRPQWNPAAPEIGDIICLTTKKALKKLVETRIEDIELRCGHRQVNFTEQYLWALLETNSTEAKNDENIHVAILRPTGERLVLS